MNPKALIKAAEQVVRSNTPAILAGLGVSGVVGTAYLSYRAGATIGVGESVCGTSGDWKQRIKDRWRHLAPPVVTGAVTIGCIIGAVKIGNRRTAAITAAYSISEKAFEEYRDKVTEKLGERKEQNIRDEMAQEKVTATAPGRDIVILGQGDVLCCDLHTGRYFLAGMVELKKAQNDVNFRVLNDGYAYLSDFYAMLKVYLPKETTYGHNMGWSKENGPMELKFSTVLAEETRPCLAFEYNYLKPL